MLLEKSAFRSGWIRIVVWSGGTLRCRDVYLAAEDRLLCARGRGLEVQLCHIGQSAMLTCTVVLQDS